MQNIAKFFNTQLDEKVKNTISFIHLKRVFVPASNMIKNNNHEISKVGNK